MNVVNIHYKGMRKTIRNIVKITRVRILLNISQTTQVFGDVTPCHMLSGSLHFEGL